MRKVLLLLSLLVGFVRVNAANVCNVPNNYNEAMTSSGDYVIFCATTATYDSADISTSGDYTGTTLVVKKYATAVTPTKYVWTTSFSGECDRYYLWPQGSPEGIKADVSIYFTDRQAGGVMKVSCDIYNGSTLLDTVYMYLYAFHN